jgi:hypothetical protein
MSSPWLFLDILDALSLQNPYFANSMVEGFERPPPVRKVP